MVLIAGPTASGKSAFAIKLAQILDGEIINADSMQVYDHLKILSARPALSDQQDIPHHMYGHIDPAQIYSTGSWLREARQTMDGILARGKVPVFVGGTGLYFKALTDGLADLPDIASSIRKGLEDKLEASGIASLYAQLLIDDRQMAERLKPNDVQRIIRALEVREATGTSLLEWQKTRTVKGPVSLEKRDTLACVLFPDRKLLYDRINHRFDTMLGLGAQREAIDFRDLGLNPKMSAMKAIGVLHLSQPDLDENALDEAIELCKRDTRRYAKRQSTWFRNQMAHWPFFAGPDYFKQVCEYWKSKKLQECD